MFRGDTDGTRDPRTLTSPTWGPPALRVLGVASGDSTTLVLDGELDLASTDHLEKMIAACAHGTETLRVDLSRLSFMDCAAVRVLVSAAELCKGIGCDLRVIGGPYVERIAVVSGLAAEPWFEESA